LFSDLRNSCRAKALAWIPNAGFGRFASTQRKAEVVTEKSREVFKNRGTEGQRFLRNRGFREQ
jgi:hypothetical protein